MTARIGILSSASALAILVALPAAAQTSPPGQAPDAGPAVVDEVVITGLRRSLQSARDLKRNATQIVDSVVAEDIGKLPDVNAADSLARVTGVQVDRANGEAGRVIVRGLPDLTTTYNGRDIFTAEARNVAVQDFPAGGVAALDVYKSTTSDLVEGGIAGLINVRSRRPFDFKGLEIAGSVRGSYANRSQRYDPNGNLLVSNRWDTGAGEVGALLNVSYTQLRYLDSARFVGGGFITAIGAGQVADPTLAGSRYSDGVGVFYGQGDRSRPSVNAAVQWRPNAALELYADLLYQGFHNKVSDRQLFTPLYGDVRFSNVTLQPGTNRVRGFTSNGQVRPELFQGASNNQTDTYQFAVGGTWNQGPWRVSTDLARTKSKYDSSIYSFDTAFATNPTVDVIFDKAGGDGGVAFSFPGFDVNDPANYRYRGFYDRHLTAKGDDVQWRGDVTYDLGEGLLRSAQAGLRYVDRDGAFRNGDRYSPQEALGLSLSQVPVDVAAAPSGFTGDDVRAVRTWPTASYDSLRRNISALRDLAGMASGDPPFDPTQSFDANEKSYAGYGQLNYGFDGALRIDGVIGLRVVRTETSIAGNVRTTVNNAPVFTATNAKSAYTDYLPSVNARIHLSDTVQLRLSANKTRTRPNFNQLNPGFSVDPNADSSGRRRANGGNIDLRPIKSENLDASLETYFSTTGFASLAVFRRKVDGFIINKDNQINDPVYGPLIFTQPFNLDSTVLKGVEAQVTTFLDFGFVPAWARSFGVQLNGTYIDGDLPGLSKTAYNIVGLYEHGPVSARLAWNSRDRFLNGCNTGFNPGCEYTKDVSRLDFSASYTPVENITLAFDASNILGQPLRSYREYQDEAGAVQGSFPRDVRYEESLYSLSVRFRY